MTDMLVKLYDLPPLPPHPLLRRGLAPEKHIVLEWVQENFSDHWRSECDVAFHRAPVSCFVAVEDNQLLGFACYDTTRRGFFGPTGVAEQARGRGLGSALLLVCLHDMYAQGYGYDVIGGVGPIEFYKNVVGAVVIEDSTPGIYAGMLRK